MRSTRIRPASHVALVVAAALAALVVGCTRDSSPAARVPLGGGVLEVSLEPRTPQVGENRLELALRSEDGHAVDAAKIEARIEMPAMGAMAAMGGPLDLRADGADRHHADFELAMPGTWRVTIVVRRAKGGALRAEGSLTVGTPGLRLAAVGGPSAEGTSDERPGEIVIPPERLQRSGITTVAVERRALPATIRAVGRVVFPEAGLVDVALKVGGFASRVRAGAIGVPVAKGDVLFELYSPELVSAQQEYLEALESQSRAHATSAPERADGLVEAARQRLHRWDVGRAELDRLEKTREVAERIAIRAPITGQIVEKNVVEGSAFAAGERLFRIAPRSPVWLEASVHESDLDRLAGTTRITVRATHAKERALPARILAILPAVDPATRTAIVRLVVDAPADAPADESIEEKIPLRPNQYANVELEVAATERLVVPESAVLQAGERSFVFRVLGEGHIQPTPVEIGLRIGDAVEVVSGVAEGDVVVRSGTFLVAAESRLRAALEQWR